MNLQITDPENFPGVGGGEGCQYLALLIPVCEFKKFKLPGSGNISLPSLYYRRSANMDSFMFIMLFSILDYKYLNIQFRIILLSELVSCFLGRKIMENFGLPKCRMLLCLWWRHHMEVGAETFDISCTGTFAPNMWGTPFRNTLCLFLKQREFNCHMWGRHHGKSK